MFIEVPIRNDVEIFKPRRSDCLFVARTLLELVTYGCALPLAHFALRFAWKMLVRDTCHWVIAN